MKLKIIEASFHRNGVCGAPFYAVLFEDRENEEEADRLMIASIFEEPFTCAVYSVARLQDKNIAFAMGNSWRGDEYEAELRPLLDAWITKKHGMEAKAFQ